MIEAVPQCFVQREISELKQRRKSVIDDLVASLIKSQLHFWVSAKGRNSSALPLTIRNVLSSRACKGAIKFGDELSEKRCADLVAELGECGNPFACAHGRPTIHPLVDLSEVDDRFGGRRRDGKTVSAVLKSRMDSME